MMKNHHQGERVQKRHIIEETQVQNEIATTVKMDTHQEEIQHFHVEVLLTLKEKVVQNSQEIIDEVMAVLPTILRNPNFTKKIIISIFRKHGFTEKQKSVTASKEDKTSSEQK